MSSLNFLAFPEATFLAFFADDAVDVAAAAAGGGFLRFLLFAFFATRAFSLSLFVCPGGDFSLTADEVDDDRALLLVTVPLKFFFFWVPPPLPFFLAGAAAAAAFMALHAASSSSGCCFSASLNRRISAWLRNFFPPGLYQYRSTCPDDFPLLRATASVVHPSPTSSAGDLSPPPLLVVVPAVAADIDFFYPRIISVFATYLFRC